jgi:hypothetical protein
MQSGFRSIVPPPPRHWRQWQARAAPSPHLHDHDCVSDGEDEHGQPEVVQVRLVVVGVGARGEGAGAKREQDGGREERLAARGDEAGVSEVQGESMARASSVSLFYLR